MAQNNAKIYLMFDKIAKLSQKSEFAKITLR